MLAENQGKAMARAIHDALGWARDAIQGRIIAQIFAQRVHGIVLKGGMAFRVQHPKWARATKDIDLDADQELSMATLQRTVRQAIKQATSDGLIRDVVITEPKQTDTTARWKISGLYPRTGQTLNLMVEVSRREHIQDDEFTEAYYGPDEPEMVRVYTDRSLAFKKVKAFLSPTREAPRDISDLFLLIQAHVEPPVEELRRWFARGGVPRLEEIWEKIERMDKETFKAEVLPSLPPSVDGQLFYQDWDEMRVTVGTHVERWVQEALARQGDTVPLDTERRAPSPCGAHR